MLKLIEELANRSLKSSMVHDGMYRPEGYANGVSKDFADKFAELIVKECVQTVQNRGGMCGLLASNWIKEHFGVEE